MTDIITQIDMEIESLERGWPPSRLGLLALLNHVKKFIQPLIDTAELYRKDNHQLEIDLAIAQAEAQDAEKHIVVLEGCIKELEAQRNPIYDRFEQIERGED